MLYCLVTCHLFRDVASRQEDPEFSSWDKDFLVQTWPACVLSRFSNLLTQSPKHAVNFTGVSKFPVGVNVKLLICPYVLVLR